MLSDSNAVLFVYRLILFLQQSSVEWCSSLWMHVIQEVDPNFQRTVRLTAPSAAHLALLYSGCLACLWESLLLLQVVVASKFDNRLKEFAERWEVDRYLSATGYLHPNAKPFFVALPKVILVHRQLLQSSCCTQCLCSCQAVPYWQGVPLSQDRSLTASSEWRHAIQQVDSAVLGHLRNEVAGGFDEEQFGNRIGFSNLKM